MSLRDVKRVLSLVKFFVLANAPAEPPPAAAAAPKKSQAAVVASAGLAYPLVPPPPPPPPLGATSTPWCNKVLVILHLHQVLAAAHVYFFRLSSGPLRRGLWMRLRSALIGVRAGDDARLPPAFLELIKEGKFDEVTWGGGRTPGDTRCASTDKGGSRPPGTPVVPQRISRGLPCFNPPSWILRMSPPPIFQYLVDICGVVGAAAAPLPLLSLFFAPADRSWATPSGASAAASNSSLGWP